jgi:hypothetical protein
MYLPEWILPFKEPRTEIKHIKGAYYKYQVRYQYNKEKGRTDKITVRLLGKITEKDGFIPSDKDLIRQKAEISPNVDTKTFGVYHLYTSLLDEQIKSIGLIFSKDVSETLFSFSMMRWAYQTPIKRAAHYHNHDFCSQQWSSGSMSDKQISAILKFVGENRQVLVDWMKSQLATTSNSPEKFVMMDSTHISTVSQNLAINAKGYNPSNDYDKQIRLMYLFSSELKQPVYYRMINGNIPDISSMALCVTEMAIKDVIFIADKGFYSKENSEQLVKNNLQYLIPIKRNNTLIDLSPFLKPSFKKETKTYFEYQGRIIWYTQYENQGQKLVTFLDEKLKVKEESDYLIRTKTHPDSFTEQGFFKKLDGFGTLTITFNIKENQSPQQIYEAYKKRNEIETMFDSYKNFLKADNMYMQDRHVLEGWLMANFIAMIAYYKLFSRLKSANLLSKYSPKDIIELSKAIHKLKINNQWHTSEISKKAKALFSKIGIDYLN